MEAMEKTDEQKFLDGDADTLRLGGYGGTANIDIRNGRVRIKVTKPKRRQKEYGEDSPKERALCVARAKAALARAKPKRGSEPPPPAVPARPDYRTLALTAMGVPRPVPLITAREIWNAYLESLLPKIPNGVRTSRPELTAVYEAMTPEERKECASYDTVWGAINAARRLDRDGVVPLDGDFSQVRTKTLTKWGKTGLGPGKSASTARSYQSRLRNAVRHFQNEEPERWADRIDPTAAMKTPSGKPKPREITEAEVEALLPVLLEWGEWQTYASLLAAYESGRRIGEISADRDGNHMDALPLRAIDFSEGPDGRLMVLWRADVRKGEGYGHGDQRIPCSETFARLVRWLLAEHRNPLGAEHPLIWNPDDPTEPESYDRMRQAYIRAWRKAFGEKKPKGLLFHSACYHVITTIADAEGFVRAAEYTGRTYENVSRVYKRLRPETQVQAVKALDERARRQPSLVPTFWQGRACPVPGRTEGAA